MKVLAQSLASLAVFLCSCFGRPATVAEITIVNRTAYDIDVEVAGGDR